MGREEGDAVDAQDHLVLVRADALVAQIDASLTKGDHDRRRAQWLAVCDALDEDVDLRIGVIVVGLPVSVIGGLAHAMGVNKGFLMRLLDITKSVVASRERSGSRLPKGETTSLLHLYAWVGAVERLKAEDRVAQDFDAARWIGKWIMTPNPGLRGRVPAGYLDTHDGLVLMGNLIERAVEGAYL